MVCVWGAGKSWELREESGTTHSCCGSLVHMDTYRDEDGCTQERSVDKKQKGQSYPLKSQNLELKLRKSHWKRRMDRARGGKSRELINTVAEKEGSMMGVVKGVQWHETWRKLKRDGQDRCLGLKVIPNCGHHLLHIQPRITDFVSLVLTSLCASVHPHHSVASAPAT